MQEARLHQAHVSLFTLTLGPLADRFDHHLRLRFGRHRRSFVCRCRRNTHGTSLARRRCRGCRGCRRRSAPYRTVAAASVPGATPSPSAAPPSGHCQASRCCGGRDTKSNPARQHRSGSKCLLGAETND
ncbi:unnamed protein product, partial [Ectocarpus sp. 8 AP-2014]